VIGGPAGWVTFGEEDVAHPAAAIAAASRIAARWGAAPIIAAVLDRLTCWTPVAAGRFRPPGGRANELPRGQQALALGGKDRVAVRCRAWRSGRPGSGRSTNPKTTSSSSD
jgi:hypothetical protein